MSMHHFIIKKYKEETHWIEMFIVKWNIVFPFEHENILNLTDACISTLTVPEFGCYTIEYSSLSLSQQLCVCSGPGL